VSQAENYNQHKGNPMDIKTVAAVCHAVNREYCQTLGDYAQSPWNKCSKEEQAGMEALVKVARDVELTPSALHETWRRRKSGVGWQYGSVKDDTSRRHPNMVPFDQLAPDQQRKSILFLAVVMGFKAAEIAANTPEDERKAEIARLSRALLEAQTSHDLPSAERLAARIAELTGDDVVIMPRLSTNGVAPEVTRPKVEYSDDPAMAAVEMGIDKINRALDQAARARDGASRKVLSQQQFLASNLLTHLQAGTAGEPLIDDALMLGEYRYDTATGDLYTGAQEPEEESPEEEADDGPVLVDEAEAESSIPPHTPGAKMFAEENGLDIRDISFHGNKLTIPKVKRFIEMQAAKEERLQDVSE
jgi:hypothetical protein